MATFDFRKTYCELLAYYQYIEMHLRGIYAALLADDERNWFDRLDDYETDPLGIMIQKIESLQAKRPEESVTLIESLHLEQPKKYFTQSDIEELNSLRQSRNYWVHQCFIGDKPVIIRRDGTVKRQKHAERLENDLKNAIAWDKKITDIENKVIEDMPIYSNYEPKWDFKSDPNDLDYVDLSKLKPALDRLEEEGITTEQLVERTREYIRELQQNK